jgi:predicted acyl esterase
MRWIGSRSRNGSTARWVRWVARRPPSGSSRWRRAPGDPAWFEGGLYHDNEPFSVPAFWFNSWFDVSQGPNLALYRHARKNGTSMSVRDGQYLLVAPTLHCGFYRIPEHEDLEVGELNVDRPQFPLYDQMFAFFDRYLPTAQPPTPSATTP